MPTLLSFRLFYLVTALCAYGFAQEQPTPISKKALNPIATIQVGHLSPNAYGDNFLSEALALQTGYLIDFKLHLNHHFYVGLQKTFFKADVANPILVGNYDNSKISHHYAQAGFSLFSVESKFNAVGGIGLGYAYYKNFQSDSKFSDDGFSLMASAAVQYQFSKIIGVFSTIQLAQDFLSINTAQEQEQFLNNATFSTFSIGVQIQIK